MSKFMSKSEMTNHWSSVKLKTYDDWMNNKLRKHHCFWEGTWLECWDLAWQESAKHERNKVIDEVVEIIKSHILEMKQYSRRYHFYEIMDKIEKLRGDK